MNATYRELKQLLVTKIAWVQEIGQAEFNNKPAKITKEELDNLLRLASSDIIKSSFNLAWNEYQEITDAPMVFPLKQTKNFDQIKAAFIEWANSEQIKTHFVYIFWKTEKEAVYIGRSSQGIKRPADHLTRYWIDKVKKVEIFPLLNKRNLAKAECLATHIFPSDRNLTRPGRIIYSAKCPICDQIKMFNQHVRKLLK